MYFSLQLKLSGPDFACSFGEKSFSKAARQSPEQNAVGQKSRDISSVLCVGVLPYMYGATNCCL